MLLRAQLEIWLLLCMAQPVVHTVWCTVSSTVLSPVAESSTATSSAAQSTAAEPTGQLTVSDIQLVNCGKPTEGANGLESLHKQSVCNWPSLHNTQKKVFLGAMIWNKARVSTG